MNGKYLFIVIANDKPSNKLFIFFMIRNKTKLKKNNYVLFCITTVIINYRQCKLFYIYSHIVSTCLTNTSLVLMKFSRHFHIVFAYIYI